MPRCGLLPIVLVFHRNTLNIVLFKYFIEKIIELYFNDFTTTVLFSEE